MSLSVPAANDLPHESRPNASAWRLLAVLTALNVLNFVDRLLIAALAPLLIAELGLSRAQIGLLAGFTFVVFYSVVGLFLGLAADRWRRIPLVSAGLALWSAMTAFSGAARSFAGLALPRLFVGVGEATLAPAALSMLGDRFPPRRLATATGIYYAAIPLGSAIGLIASSWIAPRWGWRSCFYVLGAVGLVAAIALRAVREPARRGAATDSRAPGPPAPAAPVPPKIAELAAEAARGLVGRRELLLALVGGALLCYGASSAAHVVTWLVEERGYGYANAALSAGIVAVFAGLTGNLAGGAFGDLCARRRPRGHLYSLIPMTLFVTPFGVAFCLLPPGTPLFHLCWFVATAGASAFFGPLFAAVQELSAPHLRGSTLAVALLAVNLLGVGPGPLVTGLVGDAHGLTAGLLSSFAIAAVAVLPIALALRRPRSATEAPRS